MQPGACTVANCGLGEYNLLKELLFQQPKGRSYNDLGFPLLHISEWAKFQAVYTMADLQEIGLPGKTPWNTYTST